MSTLKRKLAGLKAKNNGQDFESTCHSQLSAAGFYVLKVETGARIISIRGRKTAILMPNGFDFVAVKEGLTLLFDAKSLASHARINYSLVNNKKSSLYRQVKVLKEFEKQGGFAFFLIGYRDLDKVAIVLASQLYNLKPGESLGLNSSLINAGNYNMIDFSAIIRALKQNRLDKLGY